ncbi:MAG: peptidylprolyl isomerase [Bryobacteraceae bacterium]|jgi:peptidyl-prolyl cis-trans isomerase A (cyclophilin A)
MRSILTSILVCSALLAQAPASKSAASKGTASKTGAARPSLLNPASLRAKAPEVFKAQFTTTKGDFIIEVHRDWSPHGADRFYNLVKSGFYDGVAFYRVHPGFMVQFGISPKPEVTKAWDNANISDDPVMGSNKRGFVTYAMSSAPNSRSTQVFINFKDNAFLDPQRFAPFGEVISGMEVVDMLFSGYGEIPQMQGRGPDPDKLEAEGDAYLVKNFPMIDKIKTAKVLPAEPAAAPAYKSAPAK